MHTHLKTIGISLASVSLFAATAAAQTSTQTWANASATTAGAPAAKASNPPPVDWVQTMKQPMPWISWGADLRIRNEYFNNLLTLNEKAPLHEQDYFRFRGRIWTTITPLDDLNFFARLASEPREWVDAAGYSPYKTHEGFDGTEGIVDALNVQWKNILQQPLSITFGRQDLFLGDGWLVCDGTPNDGSWTTYLDAARITYELKEQHTVFEAIGIMQDGWDDGWMPTINNQNRIETEQNEKGAIFSVANTSYRAANITGYFIYKGDDRLNGSNGKLGDNADIYTIGGRLSGLLGDHWKYSAEGAYQFGRKQDTNIKFPSVSEVHRTINAFGVNSKITWLAKDKLNDQLNLQFEFLSGDNPKTGGDEMFDVLWGRWPRWSEIGLYSYAAESRIGQEADLIRFGPGWSISPTKKMDVSAAYYALFAAESVPTREASSKLFTRDSNFRGHFISTVVKYKFNSHVSAHLWGECLFPGDFYAHTDPIPFLRAELFFTL
jgi:hypothetical protein